jgi:hypothetical protein
MVSTRSWLCVMCQQIWLLCVFNLNFGRYGRMALFTSRGICLYYVEVNDVLA